MKSVDSSTRRSPTALKTIALAGLGGGLAEMLWVTIYSSLTHASGVAVAREVAASLLPTTADWVLAPLIGVGIHLVLSVALTAAVAWTLWRYAMPRLGAGTLMVSATAVLVTVWAVNFFVVLPALNPAFVTLMPYTVTLVSKVLFAIAMAGVLQYNAADCVEPKESKQPFLGNPLNHTLKR